jgi:ABC-type transporter Mla subunit MlaD
MTTEANKLKVGAFLIAGFFLFCGALVWIGAAHVFEQSKGYVTYFDETVNGLDIGSPVKYRGVPVGRVAAIGVAPDGKLVEVAMDLHEGFRVEPALRASVVTSGITGVSVIDIGFARSGVSSPALPFTPPERFIPSQPSVLTAFTGVLVDIASGLREADIPGLVAEFRSAAAAARERFAGADVDRVLARVAGAAEALEALTRRATALAEDPRLSRTFDGLVDTAERMQGVARSAEALVTDPRAAQALEDARLAAAELRRAAGEIRTEVAALRTGERLDSVQRKIADAVDGAEGSAKTAAGSVRETAAAATRAVARWELLAADLDRSLQEAVLRLDRAAGRLEGLATAVEANPARLLGKPPKEDFR